MVVTADRSRKEKIEKARIKREYTRHWAVKRMLKLMRPPWRLPERGHEKKQARSMRGQMPLLGLTDKDIEHLR